MDYRTINNISEYVQKMIACGAQVIVAEKSSRIAAQQGIVGECIISWSVDAEGKPVMEKEALVSVDEMGNPDWIATKIDDQGNAIVDVNGYTNQWLISHNTFKKKYEALQGENGIFKPVGGPQKFIKLNEGIHIMQWGEEWNVDAGGYINITNIEDIYVISGRDFDDTYRVVQ